MIFPEGSRVNAPYGGRYHPATVLRTDNYSRLVQFDDHRYGWYSSANNGVREGGFWWVSFRDLIQIDDSPVGYDID